MKTWLIAAILALALTATACSASATPTPVPARTPTPTARPVPTATLPSTDEPGVLTPDDGQAHIPQGTPYGGRYSNDPPTSGTHWPSFSPLGKAILTNEPDEENVHRLEHGYVIIHHNCAEAACPDVYRGLLAIYNRFPAKVILNYRPRTQSRIALTAWRRLATMDGVDEQRIVRFIQAYLEKGPEPGAP